MRWSGIGGGLGGGGGGGRGRWGRWKWWFRARGLTPIYTDKTDFEAKDDRGFARRRGFKELDCMVQSLTIRAISSEGCSMRSLTSVSTDPFADLSCRPSLG